MRTYDFAVIGGGIAGASAAYELQARGSAILLERERLLGQHTTGRSAAFLVESYGNRTVQRLTRASRRFFEEPPSGFAPHPVVEPRPILWIARSDQRLRLAEQTKLAVETGAELYEVDADEARAMCPVVREDYVVSGVVEPNARSIDVAGLLDGYLRGFRSRGGKIVARAEVTGLERVGEAWEIACGSDRYQAGVVVNAAGPSVERPVRRRRRLRLPRAAPSPAGRVRGTPTRPQR